MGKTLVIAEKPSVGQAIARVLGVSGKKDGFMEDGQWVVSWCYGHLIELEDPAAYDPAFARWSLADLPIVPGKWKYRVIESGAGQYAVLKDLMGRSDVGSLVCATDAGREGELIFRLVYAYAGCRKPCRRLWVSSLEDSAIRKGFEDLRPSSEYDPLFKAALGRSRADWLVGMNASRYYSMISPSGNGVMSVGRVQTPTLAMIVARQEEIAGFRVTTRWAVVKDFGDFRIETDRFDDEGKAAECVRATDGKESQVTAFEVKRKRLQPPLLYCLTDIQRDANRLLGFSASRTLDTMQELYEKKLLSYPRTDSCCITADMESSVDSLMAKLAAAALPDFAPGPAARLVNDSKVTDHYALLVTPTWIERRDGAGLSPDQAVIMKLVETRMLASVAPHVEYDEARLKADCEGYAFAGSGSKLLRGGWRLVESRMRGTKLKMPGALPAGIGKGTVLPASPSVQAKRETAPPKPYTEDTLLGAMDRAGAEDMPEDAERRGIGTSATRAAIIERLLAVGYIERQMAKKVTYLVATEKGKRLIAAVDPQLKTPKTTAQWEWRLLDIGRGKDSLPAFCSDIVRQISDLVRTEGVGTVETEGQVLGRCPKCGGDVSETRDGYACASCGASLPKAGPAMPGHVLLPAEMKAMLSGEPVLMALKSRKTGRDYDVLVGLAPKEEQPGGRFRMKFEFPGASGKEVGPCPRCGSPMHEDGKVFACGNKGCGAIIWKDVCGHAITAAEASQLLSGSKVRMQMVSKKDRKFTAIMSIDKADTSSKSVRLKMEFEQKRKGKWEGRKSRQDSPAAMEEESYADCAGV